MSSRSRRGRNVRVALIVVLAAVTLAVALLVARYGDMPANVSAVQDAGERLADQATALRPADLTSDTIDELASSLRDLDVSMEPLRDLVANDPLVALARPLPLVGMQVEAADALVAAADALVEAGDGGLALATKVVTLREADAEGGEVDLMPGLVELMATSGEEVDRVAGLIAEAEAQLELVPDDAIGPLLAARDQVSEPLTVYRPLLETYRDYDEALARALGWGGEKRYLVLAQNPAELRPTGGYIGTVGVLGLDAGAITELRFRDIYELDTLPGLPFVEPPEELADHLLGDEQSWRLADAGWSPDFPTSAERALEFYGLESGEQGIDGVIAITTYALDRLLEVTGPVPIAKYDLTVAPGDVTLTLLGATRGTPESTQGRKEILDVLAQEMTDRLLALPPDRWVPTIEALEDIGDRRLGLIWFADDKVQRVIEEVGWDGRVRQDEGDYLYVVESNVAPTSKYNLVVDRSDSLVVKLDEEGNAFSSLRMDWQNDAGNEGETYRFLRENSNNEQGWYGAYIRALVPAGSELVTASGQTDEAFRGVERVNMEAGRTGFGNYLLMPPGESTLTYAWTTPQVAHDIDGSWRYDLVIQRQPGAGAVPLSLALELPDGATILEVSDGLVAGPDEISGDFTLDRDIELRVRYEAP